MVSFKKKSELLIKYYIKVTCALKQARTRVLSAFHATPVSVPITDSSVTYLSGLLTADFMQLGQGSLSSGFPPSMSRNIHCKFSDRFLPRQAEHMAKETQLPKPDSFNKGSCFCEALDGSIWHPVNSPDV